MAWNFCMCCTSLIGCSNYRATECRWHSVAALSGGTQWPYSSARSRKHKQLSLMHSSDWESRRYLFCQKWTKDGKLNPYQTFNKRNLVCPVWYFVMAVNMAWHWNHSWTVSANLPSCWQTNNGEFSSWYHTPFRGLLTCHCKWYAPL